MKLCLLLCVVTFALFFIPFRFLFALILLDIFTKKITNKDGTLTKLLKDVEVTNNTNTYSFVTDDDIEKVFYELEQERNRRK